jgi:predicted phosphodiesterase
MFRVGLISDTHGLLRPEAKTFLRGCDFIVHGGDIGSPNILKELSELAPVTAVRGNNDKANWADELSQDEFLQLGDIFIYVIHDLFVNPGSSGPRRFKLPISIGELVVEGHSVSAHIHELAVPHAT